MCSRQGGPRGKQPFVNRKVSFRHRIGGEAPLNSWRIRRRSKFAIVRAALAALSSVVTRAPVMSFPAPIPPAMRSPAYQPPSLRSSQAERLGPVDGKQQRKAVAKQDLLLCVVDLAHELNQRISQQRLDMAVEVALICCVHWRMAARA